MRAIIKIARITIKGDFMPDKKKSKDQIRLEIKSVMEEVMAIFEANGVKGLLVLEKEEQGTLGFFGDIDFQDVSNILKQVVVQGVDVVQQLTLMEALNYSDTDEVSEVTNG